MGFRLNLLNVRDWFIVYMSLGSGGFIFFMLDDLDVIRYSFYRIQFLMYDFLSKSLSNNVWLPLTTVNLESSIYKS